MRATYYSAFEELRLSRKDENKSDEEFTLTGEEIDQVLTCLASERRDQYTALIGDTIASYYRIGNIENLQNGLALLGLTVLLEHLKQLHTRTIGYKKPPYHQMLEADIKYVEELLRIEKQKLAQEKEML